MESDKKLTVDAGIVALPVEKAGEKRRVRPHIPRQVDGQGILALQPLPGPDSAAG